MLLKRFLLIALLVCLMLIPAEHAIVGASEEASLGASAEPAQEATPAPDYDVELYVFLFDNCGGCGTDSPGCGNCQDIVRYHAIIKRQLGNRLYDGTILYRMYNCRIEAYDRMYDSYYAAYGIPQELYGYLPAVFIGTPDGGVYLAREDMLEYVGEYLDKYLAADDLAALQSDIDAKYARVYSEE